MPDGSAQECNGGDGRQYEPARLVLPFHQRGKARIALGVNQRDTAAEQCLAIYQISGVRVGQRCDDRIRDRGGGRPFHGTHFCLRPPQVRLDLRSRREHRGEFALDLVNGHPGGVLTPARPEEHFSESPLGCVALFVVLERLHHCRELCHLWECRIHLGLQSRLQGRELTPDHRMHRQRNAMPSRDEDGDPVENKAEQRPACLRWRRRTVRHGRGQYETRRDRTVDHELLAQRRRRRGVHADFVAAVLEGLEQEVTARVGARGVRAAARAE